MKKNTKILIGLLILVLIGGGVFYGVSDMGAGQIKKLNLGQKKSPNFKEMKEPELGSVIAKRTNKVIKKKQPVDMEPDILEAVSGLDAAEAKKLDFKGPNKGPNIVPKKEKKSDILVPKIFNFDADVAKKLADAKAAADAQAAADSKAAAAKKIADVQKLAKYEAEAKAAYEKKIADAQAAEAKKLADAKHEAEGKKLADAKVAADAKKIAKAEYEKKLAEAIAEYEAIEEDIEEKLDPSPLIREDRYYDPKVLESDEDWYKEYIYYISRMETEEGKIFSTLEKMILKAMWSEAWTSERAASEELPY